MKTYQIEIKEFLSRTIEIEANSVEEAVSMVKNHYQHEEIVLDSDDCVTTEIDEYEDK